MLADPARKALAMQSSAEGLTLTVPATAPDPVSSTIVLQVKGPLDIEQPAWSRITTARLFCPLARPACTASEIKYETGDQRDYLGFWTNPDRLGRLGRSRSPGPASLKSPPNSPPRKASLKVSVGDSRATGAASATGDYGKFKAARLGVLEIASPGKVTLAVRPVKDGWHPLNLKAIRLKPVAAAQ